MPMPDHHKAKGEGKAVTYYIYSTWISSRQLQVSM